MKYKMNRTEQILYWSFVLCCMICFQPVKTLSYVTYLFFFVPILIFDYEYKLISFSRLLIVALVFVSSFLWYNFVINADGQYLKINHVISFVYWGHFWGFFILRKRGFFSDILQERIFHFIIKLLFIEGTLGCIQFFFAWGNTGFDLAEFKGAVGDFVSGTMRRPFFPPSVENLFFVLNMTVMTFYCICYSLWKYKRVRYKGILLIAMVSLLLASAVHLMLMFMLALIMSFLLLSLSVKNAKKYLRYFIVIVVPAGLGIYIYYKDYVINHFTKTLITSSTKSAKLIVTFDIVLEYYRSREWYFWFGTGFGQMVSKVGWLLSGYSFETFTFDPGSYFLEASYRQDAKRLIYDPISSVHILESSSFNTPFYSMLAFFSEFGLVGLLGYYIAVGYSFFHVLYRVRRSNNSNFPMGIFCLSCIVVLAEIPFVAYYVELSQAVFIMMILTYISYMNLSKGEVVVAKV